MINNEFALSFEKKKVDLFFSSTYYYFSFSMDGFIVMDLENVNNNNPSFSYVAFSSNHTSNVILLHVRLIHIGEDHMGRLAKNWVVTQFTKR